MTELLVRTHTEIEWQVHTESEYQPPHGRSHRGQMYVRTLGQQRPRVKQDRAGKKIPAQKSFSRRVIADAQKGPANKKYHHGVRSLREKARITKLSEMITRRTIKAVSAVRITGREVCIMSENLHHKQVTNASWVRCAVSVILKSNTGFSFAQLAEQLC